MARRSQKTFIIEITLLYSIYNLIKLPTGELLGEIEGIKNKNKKKNSTLVYINSCRRSS